MAITVLFNGVTYSIPETGEESWGSNLTSYFTAIPQGALQKSGGAFTLTADVNFGANYGLLSKYFTSRTASAATAGQVRLARADVVSWRNQANDGNLDLGVNSSNVLVFNGGTIPTGGITALTGDVTATGPGSVAATVAFVGGYSAANVAAGATLANAATDLNTVSAIVKRDGSGNFVAGTITAALTGTASGNTTITPNQYGMVVSGAANVLQVVPPDASTTKVWVSGGASANPSWQDISAGVLALATFGSTPNASGASLSGATLTLQPADGTNPGGVTAGAQTIGGVKTFSSAPIMSPLTALQVVVTDGSKALASLAYATANTGSALVQRDGSGNFAAGTATLVGALVSGLTASQAVVTDGSKNLASLAYASAATASALMTRDSNGNTNANNVITNYATTATAAGTTALTVASAHNQFFTGVTTQNVTLPDATTLTQTGFQFFIVNLSSGAITVKDAGGNNIQVMAADSFATFTAKSIGSSNGSWQSSYSVNNAGGGTVTSVAMTVPTALFASSPVSGSPVTTSGTLAPTLATQTARTFFQGPQSGSAATPTFAALAVPTQQSFTSTGTPSGYVFTISSGNATVGATYTNNGNTFTVLETIAAATRLFTSGASAPQASGTLTRATGSGDATLTFSAAQAIATYTTPTNPSPLWLEVEQVAGGGGGAGSSTSAASNGGAGTAGSASYFGTNLLISLGGSAGGTNGGNGPGGAGGTGSINSPAYGSAPAAAYGQSSPGSTATANTFFGGGNGGSNPLGGGGPGGPFNQAAPNAPANTGGGGGAAGCPSVGSCGGAGGSGNWLKAIIPNPSGTYFYAVGVKGTKGTGGTSGFAGGDGSDGKLIVTAHFQ